MKIFVDTSAWLALAYKNDKNHLRAVDYYKKIIENRYLIITTDYILDETITRLRYDLGYEEAVKFIAEIDSASNNGLLKIESIGEKIFKNSIKLFKKYQDQVFSLTDCTSFVLCEKNNIRHVFAYDKDFIIMGFVLPEE